MPCARELLDGLAEQTAGGPAQPGAVAAGPGRAGRVRVCSASAAAGPRDRGQVRRLVTTDGESSSVELVQQPLGERAQCGRCGRRRGPGDRGGRAARRVPAARDVLASRPSSAAWRSSCPIRSSGCTQVTRTVTAGPARAGGEASCARRRAVSRRRPRGDVRQGPRRRAGRGGWPRRPPTQPAGIAASPCSAPARAPLIVAIESQSRP